ncbi:MAG: hypothetical protein ACYCZX_02660 [Rhodospirillaceae bacterium]
MTVKSERAISVTYANLMDEVKARIHCIDRAVNGQTQFPAPIVREFCYLQLRFLCELIALSCLVAHGDIPATYSKQLGKKWSADSIIGDLEKLRPHFYPVPYEETNRNAFSNPVTSTNRVVDKMPFPKEALLDLYGQCHQHTHRGNVRKILNSAAPIDTKLNSPEIISWAQKINDQLSSHIIAISDVKLMFCVLRNKNDNNKVQAGFMLKRHE